MIDIKEELLSIENDWYSKYVSIYSLFQSLKKQNSTLCYEDIAKYLLVKLKEYNPESVDHCDYPDIFFQDDCQIVYGSSFTAFTILYGFTCYKRGDDNIAKNLAYKSSNLFFDFLKVIKNNNFSPEISIALDEFDFEFAYINQTYIDKEKIETALGLKFDQESLDLIDRYINDQASTLDDRNLLKQITTKDEEIARLKEEIAELKKAQPAGKIQQERISQPQRDLFTLLVMNCYGERQSRNDLFNAINADLRAKGIRTSEVKYSTFDKLIDNEIRINKKSPFPPKQK